MWSVPSGLSRSMSASFDRQAAGAEVVECALGVDRVVEHDRVDDQAERAELFFLALAVALAQFAAVAVADIAGEGVAALAAVELGEDATSERLVVAVVQQVHRLRDPPDMLQRVGERGRGGGCGCAAPGRAGWQWCGVAAGCRRGAAG